VHIRRVNGKLNKIKAKSYDNNNDLDDVIKLFITKILITPLQTHAFSGYEMTRHNMQTLNMPCRQITSLIYYTDKTDTKEVKNKSTKRSVKKL